MTIEEFMAQVDEQLRYLQFATVGRIDKLEEQIARLKEKVFDLENKGVDG